jgi:uncharacterized membrane protein
MSEHNTKHLKNIGRFNTDASFDMLYTPALAAYLLMALALVHYVKPKFKNVHSKATIFATGALMGMIIYGVFDMTNLAILKDYPGALFIIPDIVWGGMVFGLSSLILNACSKKD